VEMGNSTSLGRTGPSVCEVRLSEFIEFVWLILCMLCRKLNQLYKAKKPDEPDPPPRAGKWFPAQPELSVNDLVGDQPWNLGQDLSHNEQDMPCPA
jgi:hypothetical protein